MSETKRDDGGPAFAKPASPLDGVDHDQMGMSLRDYFAAKAMSSLAHPESLDFGTNANPRDPWPWIAEQSYLAADAMLAARNK